MPIWVIHVKGFRVITPVPKVIDESSKLSCIIICLAKSNCSIIIYGYISTTSDPIRGSNSKQSWNYSIVLSRNNKGYFSF